MKRTVIQFLLDEMSRTRSLSDECDPEFVDWWDQDAAEAYEDADEDADEREPAIEDDHDWIRSGC